MADRYPYRAERAGARDNHGPARASESDPLAELARLIGQTDPNALPGRGAAPQRANYPHQLQQHPQDQDADYQDQHYQDPRHQDQRYHDQHAHDQYAEPADSEPAQPSWMRTAASSSWQQQSAPAVHPVAPEPQHYAHEDQYSDTPAFLRTARQQHDHTRYDDVLYDQNSQNAQHQQYADGQYQDDYQDQADPNAYPPYYADAEQEEPRRRRGGLMTVLAVVVLAFVGTAAAYGYRSFTGSPRSGDPPVIKAEPGANKIVPPTQTTDATGKIVDRIGGNGQERVVSREEQPVDINGRGGAPRVVFPPPNLSPPPQQVATAAPQSPQATGSATGSNGALGDEPKRVRTYAIRPDQPDAVPQGSAPAPRAPTQARAQAPAAAANAPVSLAPGAAPAPTTRSLTAAATPAPAPAATGGYMVQITSQRSEADAQASYRAVQSKYPDVLASHTPSIRRADLGEKGIYYRALIGPFGAAEEAGKLCTSLKSAGGQCVVQRN
jgi:hypothetical protein